MVKKHARCLMVAVAAFILGTGVGGFVRSTRSATQAESAKPPDPWWRAQFPPDAVNHPPGGQDLGDLEIDAEKIDAGLACGSLDDVKIQPDGGVFAWGWAYDPRSGAAAAMAASAMR